MTDKYLFRKSGIKKRVVAIIVALTLVTTISYYDCFPVYAEEETSTEASETAESAESTESTDSTNPEDEGDEANEASAESSDEETQAEDAESEAETETDEEFDISNVTSSSYIVMSGSTSEVVVSQHSDRKMAPGKITALVTAMVVIDNMYNERELDNTVTIDEALDEYGDTFELGEKITVRDLLNAALVGGSGQAAECLASYSASKRSIFVKEMNSKAMELGLLDTHFTNPSGSYNAKQYSSAADCAKIAQAAMRYQLIKEAFDLTTVSIAVQSGTESREITFDSTNPLLASNKESDKYEYINGGILGTLSEPSTSTQYAGIATIDDMQLIVILMDSSESNVPYEAKGLLDYANTKVTRNTIVKSGKRVGSIKVRGGDKTRVNVYTATKGFAYVPPEGSDELITTEVVLYKNLEAPLSAGEKVGEYRIKVADELKGTVDLVIKTDVNEGWLLSKIYISNNATIAIGVLLIFAVLLRLRALAARRKRRKIKELRRKQKLRQLALEQMQMDEDREARNWTYSTSYEKLPPRTIDIRKESIASYAGVDNDGDESNVENLDNKDNTEATRKGTSDTK